MTLKRLMSGMFCAALAVSGCTDETSGSGDDSVDSVDGATVAAAIEVNDDGTDHAAPDAVEGGPLLLRGCGLGLIRRHVVGEFDRDGDGAVGEDERPALEGEFGGPPPRPEGMGLGEGGAPPVLRPEGPESEGPRPPRAHDRGERVRFLLGTYDLDGDGSLSDEEQATLEADLEARCQNRMNLLLAEFDANGDGELDEAEWDAAHEAIRARFEARHAEVLAEFDADGNGELDEEERHAAHEARRAAFEAELSAFDADGDGELSDEERAALVEFVRARVRGDHWETAADAEEPPHG